MKKDKLRGRTYTALIRVCNITIAQSIALEDMLSTWQGLGSAGASRWTSFFADGDGNFRPNILYNGHPPQKTDLLEEEDTWQGRDYKIDFDAIGWKLYDKEELRVKEAKKFSMLYILTGMIKFGIIGLIKDIKIKLNNIGKRSKKCKKFPSTHCGTSEEISYDISDSPQKSDSDQRS